MAYPDEPQRPLSAESGGVVAAPPAPPLPLSTAVSLPYRHVARGALLLFAAAFAVCLLVYVVASVPGSWFPGATTQVIGASAFTVNRGTAMPDGDAIAVSATDASGLALIAANTDARSLDYPIVAWKGFGFRPDADVHFLWRTDYAPNKLHSVPVPIVAGRLAPLAMANNPDWVGRVRGVALAIRGTIGEPVRIVNVRLEPGGVLGQIAGRIGEWSAFEPWSGTSINTITGGADVQELPLPTLLVVAGLVALAAWAALAWRRRRLAAFPAAAAIVFLAAWVVLDAQWMLNLTRQAMATRAQYGDKDWRASHLAAEDGPLFAFVEKARAKIPEKARVFIVSDAAYFRGRAAYHLYPLNVLFDPFRDTLPQASWLAPGDYILVWHRRGVQFNQSEGKLRLGNDAPIAAEAVLMEPGAALLKVL